MCDGNCSNASHVYIGKAVEALFYDAESVSRAKVIARLSLLFREEPDPARQNEIISALILLSEPVSTKTGLQDYRT
ncbi:hypothetical protein GC087_23700 (plasmid) [Pantoea sp. JZ2]|uniref:Uncharacterized protein n=1 Tax=Pantoea stewartii TaxID=66269 RepID=A0AB34VES5_9GAMM|nr:hypothetical protein XB02_13250 [Pantoea ananatis]KTS26237.1 hypothetical protein NS381_17120 [Pantoea stewartii]WRH15609.1 hypothetical protein GC087_23700 [Pantoea sp. JZ2]KTS73530.1 hypothetical protein RSA30_09810 [Pantoea stewartii]KTS96670.1 hypothetical protein RSA13_13670 [Pantoea stewartii]